MKQLSLTVLAASLPLFAACVAPESTAPIVEAGTVDFGDGPVEIGFVDRDGHGVVDDMILGPSEALRAGTWGVPRPDANGRTVYSAITPFQSWPNGRIVYEIDTVAFPPGSTVYNRIHDAVDEWNSSTIVRLVERSAANANEHYVRLVHGDGAPGGALGRGEGLSAVGLQLGTHQEIWLGGSVSRPTIVHEIGHTVGLFHMHSSADRDRYVIILEDNIEAGQEANFWIKGLAWGPYDLTSRMHYGSYTFGIRNRPTILRRVSTLGTACVATNSPPPECLITTSDTLTDIDKAAATRVVTAGQPGALRLENDANGLCLRPSGGTMTAGAAIGLSACDNDDSRRWSSWTVTGTTTQVLLNRQSRLCLTVSGNTFTQTPCTGATNQRVAVVNSTGGTKWLQTPTGCIVRNGAGLEISPACLNTASHRWFQN